MLPTSYLVDPPETIGAGALLLRKPTVDDAEALALAIGESLDHLSPWMPWATRQAATTSAQVDRLHSSVWGPDYMYVMVDEGESIVGGCGLHRRSGPGSLEIGYWVHVQHLRRGYATSAARALAQVARSIPDIDRVEIHCDEGNVASARVARRLGFRLDRVEDHAVEAPADTGRLMVWVSDAAAGEAGDSPLRR